MTDEKLADTVNRSGFPLQIHLEHLVNETTFEHGWKAIYSEHSWRNPLDGSSGFIDLVLEDRHGTSVLIVESKRVLDASWIFLIDDSAQSRCRHAKGWLTRCVESKFTYFGLKEMTVEPSTPQSQYCVVDGQDPKNKPMLERIGADVASSAEGFANEERTLHLKDREALRMYFNVVVTTATLKVCSFNAANVALADGKVHGADFSEVPYVRFRKQLVHHHDVPEHFAVGGHKTISRAKESTVFVVNACALLDFLREFEVDNASLRGVI